MAALTSKVEMPSFSYAQAAKGLSAAASSPQPAKSPTDIAGTTIDDELSHAEVSEASSNKTPTETSKDSDKVEAAADPESKSTTTGSSKNAVSGMSSPSFGTASTSTLPKEDDISVIPNGTSDSTWDKQSQASVPVDNKSSIAEDPKKEESTDTTEKSTPKELKAAPIPTVNIWQQRIEALEAKGKAHAPALKPVSPNTSKLSNTKPMAASSLPGADNTEVSKAGHKKKVAESSSESTVPQGKDRKRADGGKARDDSSKKSSNRLPRSNDESTESAPPSVADATAWPTPQTALGEEKRKAQEKSEKTDRNDRSPVIRGKEKWTPVPYVPTAVFNTPLPSAARRGGRPSRGGRDNGRGGAHGSHNAAGADNKSISGQNQASSKQAALPERGRNETHLARTNSLPAQGRRPTSVDVNVQVEPRRPSQGLDRSRGESRAKAGEDVQTATNGSQTNASDATAKSQLEGRPGKAQEFIPASKGVDPSSKVASLPAEDQGNNRFTSGHSRFEGIPRSGEFSRDSKGFVPKERDHRDFTRDKGEFQRDREQPRERGEARPERGRGGYRGRGGHSYGNGQQSQHFSNSQISQHPFIATKSFSVNDRPRPQQQGFPNGTQSHNSSHRLSLRSPSLPNSAGLYGAYPLPDINTMYAGYQPMNPAPMTAIPYQPYMEPFSLFGMIQMQLEYYFSVDNLCKDMFLRKHMDSQGFVLLTFIASFKRIKNLTEDFEFLRQSCRHLRNVEHHFGEDGYDRLRPREKWEQWVLPAEQRDQSAQKDGSAPNFHYPKPHDRHDDHVSSPHNGIVPLTNGFGHGNFQTANGLPNGAADHGIPPTPLSSTAPEFTPLVPAEIQSESLN